MANPGELFLLLVFFFQAEDGIRDLTVTGVSDVCSSDLDAVINDGPGLMLIVEKYPWGNTLEVTRGVEAALDELKPGLADVEIDSKIFRPAEYIDASIDNLSHALVLGCVLVILVVFAFLYEVRTALICIVAIPLSLLAAVLVLEWSGLTLNTMVLAGFVIALRVGVHDAILGVEHIDRKSTQLNSSHRP